VIVFVLIVIRRDIIMSRERLERAIEKNIKEVMDTGEVMERAKLKEYVKDLNNKLPDNMVEEGVSPEHYARWKFEPITFIMENNIPYAVGNVIKYVMRYDSKDGLKDLKKARRYIDMLIEQEYGKENV
jgi:hypothetical protein